MQSQTLGSFGERIAVAALKRKHFTILECNFRTRYGEIDIIARRGNTVHFVEVKTRSGDRHGKPYEAVRPWKIRHLLLAAQAYVLQNDIKTDKLMIDVVSIVMNDQKKYDIQFFENITQ